MAIIGPTEGVLKLECDACFATIDFTVDEGHPVADVAACLRLAKEAAWKSEKHVGYSWEHYCPVCADLPDDQRHPRSKPITNG